MMQSLRSGDGLHVVCVHTHVRLRDLALQHTDGSGRHDAAIRKALTGQFGYSSYRARLCDCLTTTRWL